MHSPSFRMIVWITAGVVRDVAACLRPAADAAPVALPGPALVMALECVVLSLPPERTLDRPAGTVTLWLAIQMLEREEVTNESLEG